MSRHCMVYETMVFESMKPETYKTNFDHRILETQDTCEINTEFFKSQSLSILKILDTLVCKEWWS